MRLTKRETHRIVGLRTVRLSASRGCRGWQATVIGNYKRVCVHEWSSSWLVAQPEAIHLGVTSVNSLLSLMLSLSPQLGHRCSKAIANHFSSQFCWVAVTRMSDNCAFFVPIYKEEGKT